MEQASTQTHFSRSVLAGLFAGIIATLLNLIFNVFYREYTLFPLNDIINVSSLIFATCLVLTIAGVIYHYMDQYIKGGTILFIVVFLILTLLLVRFDFHVQRSDNPVWNAEFSKLFLGVILISGLSTVLLIPYMVKKENSVI